MIRILPYLVAILVAVAMFRASGALDLRDRRCSIPSPAAIGFPAAALPMALLRPLSGSGAFAVMSEIVMAHGPDSFIGKLACTLQGSTETTFYVLTLYFGASGTRNIRHTLVACLIGDVAGCRRRHRRVSRVLRLSAMASRSGARRRAGGCAARAGARGARRAR